MRRPTYVSGLSKFQSTLPTRGSDVTIWKSLLKLPISIHAPHEGERHKPVVLYIVSWISIHAPHEGERLIINAIVKHHMLFQSTLPTRGSDVAVLGWKMSQQQISIHAPHEGERPATSITSLVIFSISIHAPHEGERQARQILSFLTIKFQSTLPTRGSDFFILIIISRIFNFNPRSPRGGATVRSKQFSRVMLLFQSTLPTRGSDILCNRKP